MPDAPELTGIIDGRYRVDGRVGKGGFGDVYAGLHLVLDVKVAIKVLRLGEGLTADQRADLVTRFLDEGRLLTRLRHPNVVAAIDLGLLPADADGAVSPYLVMEWVEGETLAALLAAREAPLSLAEAWSLFEPLAEALAHAHGAGVVHRDLKPANVMVVNTGNGRVPRVIDFGVAKLVAPDDLAGHGWTETTSTSPFTPAYAAPEQITHSRTGPWTDVHALGLLLVELVTGRAPYGPRDNARIAAVDPVRPTPRAAGVDVGALEDVVAKALALRPGERWANASELLAAARAAMQTMGGALPRLAAAPIATAAEEPDTARPAAQRAPASLLTEPSSDVARAPVARAPVVRAPPTPPAAHPTPAGHVTAPPASHTLASNAPPSMPASRRRIVGASIAVAVAIAGVAGLVVPRLRPRAAPTASASAPPPAASASSTLDAISAADLTDRVRRAGVPDSVYSSDSGPPTNVRSASWLHDNQTWIVTIFPLETFGAPAHPSDVERAALVDSVVKGYRLSGLRGMYGYDASSLVVVQTSAPFGAAERELFDKFFDGVALLARDTVAPNAGPDASAHAHAKRLRDLAREELTSRVSRTGVAVASSFDGAFDGATVTFTHASGSGVVSLYRKDAKAMRESFRRNRQSFAYAIDGDTFVAITGAAPFTTKAFLAQALAGLGANVQEERF